MSPIPTKHIDGDVAVGRNVSAGGDVNIQGDTRIGHNLKVEGWVDAKNIKGPLKGLFLTEEKLNASYPYPEDGWYAMVGATLPAALYVAEGGEWCATGQNAGSPETDLTEYREALKAVESKADNNELQSVTIESKSDTATLTVKTKGRTVTCSIPLANREQVGFITSEDAQTLESADKRAGTYPATTVATLLTDSTRDITASIAGGDMLQAVNVVDKTEIWPHVVTDGERLQLWIYVYATEETYYADTWGDTADYGISSSQRYNQPSAVMVDVSNSTLYMWNDDQSGLIAIVTEYAKGAAGGIATLDEKGKVPETQLPPSVYEVQEYYADIEASGLTVNEKPITSNYQVMWLLNEDGTGRFAAQAVPSYAGQPLYGIWPNSERMCNVQGRPLRGKIYRRCVDNALMSVSEGNQKLERMGTTTMQCGSYILRVSETGIEGSRDGGETWESIWE